MFDRITESSPLTDFVNLPTPIYLGLEAGARPLGPAAEVERELDLSSGLLSLRYAAQGPGGSAEVYERRFFSMAGRAGSSSAWSSRKARASACAPA